jgi:hypothetical protein
MSFKYDDYDESEIPIDNLDGNRYCEDCKWLTEAVRDFEQQRREVMHQHSRGIGPFSKFSGDLAGSEELFFSKMSTLDHRRNAALDVLAKHQQLEHQ